MRDSRNGCAGDVPACHTAACIPMYVDLSKMLYPLPGEKENGIGQSADQHHTICAELLFCHFSILCSPVLVFSDSRVCVCARVSCTFVPLTMFSMWSCAFAGAITLFRVKSFADVRRRYAWDESGGWLPMVWILLDYAIWNERFLRPCAQTQLTGEFHKT